MGLLQSLRGWFARAPIAAPASPVVLPAEPEIVPALPATTTAMRDAALEAAIAAAPYDADALAVYADWLTERGDIRGEYIALEIALATRVDSALEARRQCLETAFIAHLRGARDLFDSALGFARTLQVHELDERALRASLAHPAAVLVDTIVAPAAHRAAIAAIVADRVPAIAVRETAVPRAPLVGDLEVGADGEVGAWFEPQPWMLDGHYAYVTRATVAIAGCEPHTWSFGATGGLTEEDLDMVGMGTGGYLVSDLAGARATVAIEVRVTCGAAPTVAVYRGAIDLVSRSPRRHPIRLALDPPGAAPLAGVPFEPTPLAPLPTAARAPIAPPRARHRRGYKPPALDHEASGSYGLGPPLYDAPRDRTIQVCCVSDDDTAPITVIAWRDGTSPAREVAVADAGWASADSSTTFGTIVLLPDDDRFLVLGARGIWLVDPTARAVSCVAGPRGVDNGGYDLRTFENYDGVPRVTRERTGRFHLRNFRGGVIDFL